MKSSILAHAIVFNLGLLTACGGVSNIGSGDAGGPSLGAGGFNNVVGTKVGGSSGTGMDAEAGHGNVVPEGGTGVMTAGSGGRASVVVGGNGGASSQKDCMSDFDCLGGDGCEPCADGGFACGSFCKAGKCQFLAGTCPSKCSRDDHCVLEHPDCIDCGGGTRACAQSSCQMGFCRMSKPVCPVIDSCMGLACGAPCKQCTADGMCQSGSSYCDGNGKCIAGSMPMCSSAACMTKEDCGEAPPMCSMCKDGSCASLDCMNGMCALTCPNVVQQCKYTEECSMLAGTMCNMCPSGKCAIPACIQSSCQLVCPIQ